MKHSRPLLNLALLLVVIALVVIVYNEIQQPQKTLPILTDMRSESVASIRIERNNQEPLYFVNSNAQWRIRAPIDHAANLNRVEALLRLLTTTSHSRFAAPESNLQIYGLDKPLATITFDTLRIEFGDTEPVNRRRYVRVGDTIHLIADTFFHQLKIELPSFVANKLFDKPIVQIRYGKTDISKNTQGGWQVSDNNASYTQDQLQAFMDEWQYLQATRIERSQPGLPADLVNIHFADGTQMAFEILKEATALRHMAHNLRFTISDAQFRKLFSLGDSN